MRWTVCWVLLVGGCGSSGEGGDAGPPDAPVDDFCVDPSCCFEPCATYLECASGEVLSHEEGDNCSPDWDQVCPIATAYTCAESCAVDGAFAYEGTPPEALCEETPSKQVGDPCNYDEQCWPTRAVLGGDGTLTTVHLECDRSIGECVAADPPVVEDWLRPCVLVTFTAAPGEVGLATSDARPCGGGPCMFADDPDAGCVRSACTALCNGDQDCPSGSFCDDSFDTGIGQPAGVCKQGPAGDFADLECPACDCDLSPTRCDAAADASSNECACDPDCEAAGNQACTADAACDERCDPSGVCTDPDCSGTGLGECAGTGWF